MNCSRCGVCCQKGGPALHEPDLELLSRGLLSRTDLVTLRQGELAYDPIQGGLKLLDTEIVKIKGIGGDREDSWACRLFDPLKSACAIHDSKPVECAALDCKNPENIEQVMRDGLISRAHLASPGSGMGDLLLEHEAKCPMSTVAPLAQRLASGDKGAARPLLELVEYDRKLRAALVQKAGAKDSELDFFFGRPLFMSVEAFGLQLIRKAKASYALKRIPPRSRCP